MDLMGLGIKFPFRSASDPDISSYRCRHLFTQKNNHVRPTYLIEYKHCTLIINRMRLIITFRLKFELNRYFKSLSLKKCLLRNQGDGGREKRNNALTH
jgi:hypothetical protein